MPVLLVLMGPRQKKVRVISEVQDQPGQHSEIAILKLYACREKPVLLLNTVSVESFPFPQNFKTQSWKRAKLDLFFKPTSRGEREFQPPALSIIYDPEQIKILDFSARLWNKKPPSQEVGDDYVCCLEKRKFNIQLHKDYLLIQPIVIEHLQRTKKGSRQGRHDRQKACL